MPSKAKKQPKTTPLPSKPNFPDQSPSPYSRTPTTPLQLTYGSEEDVFNALEEASRIFPALLRNSALIGQVTSVASDNSKGCTVWLSEAAMVSSSLVPGSIVSVSLASLHTGVSDSFPLRSLEAECSMNMGINSGDAMANQVGNYFALATVFPSCKVSKKGVCLSLSLSYSMGCPASGSFIFVSFIQNQSLTGTVNGSDKPLNAAVVNQLSLYKCKELYLKLVPATNRSNIKRNVSSSIKYQEDTTDDHSRNQIFSTPKTESYQSRLNSPNSGPLPSARSEDSETMPFNSMKTPFDSVDVHEVLGDESTKKLLQTCANSWLNSRSLLYGNLVTIPILSEVCIFQVIGTNRLLLDDSNRDCTGENGSKISPQALKLVDHVDAFVVDGETKVYFYLPLGSTLQTPNIRSLPVSDIDCENVKEEAEGESLKLGGLSKEYAILKDIIYSSSVKDILSSLGLRSTKGVLLHGPPGTGKTSLARLCAHDAGVKVFSINGPELVSQYYGESEKALHELFDSASQSAPAVVFIDELDAIAPARKDGGEELSQRMVATLLNLMDGISSSDGIIIIAATNRPDCIEPALRRPGRLDREIEIGVPSPEQRRDILHTLISVMKHTLTNDEIKGLAINTHGFVGADLSALCNEAALVCLRRYITQKKLPGTLDPRSMKENGFEAEKGVDYPKDDSDSSSSFEFLPSVNQNGISDNIMDIIPDGHGNNIRAPCALGEDHMLKVTIEDFEKARIKVKPSAMREVILEVPKVTWEDVGGQKEVKAQLREAVEWPQKHQDAFKRIGTTPPSGVLLFGPPGCSKTLMARAVASEAGLNFLAVKGPELFSKWVGESEKAVKALFAKARANAPSVIFFDEIDGLAITRGRESDGISVSDRVISQLLVEMDGLQQRVNVTVIAATNRPDKIDPALLRPGRFDRLLYVGPPNESDREDIFRIHLRKIPCSLDVSAKELAALTEGFTGADISLVCREGAVAALEESLIASEVRMKHLKSAIELVQPSEIPSYKELSAKFQRLVQSSATKEESKCQSLPSQTNPTSRTSWTSFW